MENKKFYLAHPFESREYVLKWQEKLLEKVAIEIINPLHSEDLYENYNKMNKSEKYLRKLKEPAREIVRRDKRLMRKADGLIGIVNEVESHGTTMKIEHAWDLRKPVYLIITNDDHEHPWFYHSSDECFTTFEKFDRWAKKKWPKENI